MLQLPLATGQSAADLPQRMRSSKLAEQHGDELPPTTEALCTPFGLMFFDCLLKFHSREQLQQLRENATESCHGGVSSVDLVFLPNPKFSLQEAPPTLVFQRGFLQRLRRYFFCSSVRRRYSSPVLTRLLPLWD